MLFHSTREDDIRVIHEQGPAQTDAGGSTFACEQELKLCRQWPIKRLIEIWSRLPRLHFGGSVHGSQDCDCADLASHSAANTTRSYDRATET
jgi:hypothetical protein